jgi:hypothetical protein
MKAPSNSCSLSKSAVWSSVAAAVRRISRTIARLFPGYPLFPAPPQDLRATVLHASGVPLQAPFSDTRIIRPPFSTGKPVIELFR